MRLKIIFFFNDTATTEIYTLSLHDALPIWWQSADRWRQYRRGRFANLGRAVWSPRFWSGTIELRRSEEHTSELQSRLHLVCRLLLEKKKKVHKELRTVLYTLNSIELLCVHA